MDETKNEPDENVFATHEKENTVYAKKEEIKFSNSRSNVGVICSENKNGTKSKDSSKNYIQWVATFAMFLLMMVTGLHLGWTSPNFARFSMNNSEILVTHNELILLGSFDSLGSFLGAILGPISIEFFGPKRTGLFSFGYFCVSWICIMVANNYFWLLIIARFIGGLTISTANLCAIIYLGEISEPTIRGTLISISLNGVGIGVILGTFLETYLDPKISCPIYLIHCFIGLALLSLVLPESPYFLIKSRDIEKTRKSIQVYFSQQETEEKLKDVQKFLEDKASTRISDRLKMLKSAPVNKSLILIVLLSSLIQSSGFMNILRFKEIILQRAKVSLIEPQKLVLYINILETIVRFFTCNLADKLGRKFLLVMASMLVSLSLLGLGIYFYLLNINITLHGFEWIVILLILFYIISFSTGFYTGLSTILSEIFSPNVKSAAACIALLAGTFSDFILSTVFLPISDSFGEEYIFWIHATSAFLVTPLAIFFLPETKGKTLEEIQNNLLKK